MKITCFTLFAPPLALLLAACSPGTDVSTGTGNVSSDGKSITLRAEGHPEAKIAMDGELTIDGKVVAVNAAQRALLQSYISEMNGMTTDGIAIGKQGAALAGTAVSEAIKGAINGKGEQIDAKIEAEAKKIEQQALQLCNRLVTIKASQDALAQQLPAFKPYATIDTSDVDDCGSRNGESYAAGKSVGSSMAKAVKGEQDASASPAATATGNAAAEADAAAAAEGDASKQ